MRIEPLAIIIVRRDSMGCIVVPRARIAQQKETPIPPMRLSKVSVINARAFGFGDKNTLNAIYVIHRATCMVQLGKIVKLARIGITRRVGPVITVRQGL